MNNFTPNRTVRSYVVRAGRMTPGQKTALDTLWPRYGLETRPDQDLLRTLGCPDELVVEIGFGNGDALLELAGSQPDTCFIGIDVHPPGIGRLLAGIEQHRLANVRVMRGDALDIFELSIPRPAWPGSTSGFRIRGRRRSTGNVAWSRRPTWPAWSAACDPAASCTWPPTGRTTRSRCSR